MILKNVFLIAVGIVLGLLIYFLIYESIDLPSDRISLISIIINILLVVSIVSYFQNKESNSRSVKNYFINQVDRIKTDYDIFITSIKNEDLSSKEIKKKIKDFSIKNTQLEYFLKKDIGISIIYMQSKNREIHKLITDSYEFNNIYNDDKFIMENKINSKLIQLHREYNHHLTSLVININKT